MEATMPALEFAKRARIRQTETSRQRAYTSLDGRYRVIEVKSVTGCYWLAVRRLEAGEYPISRHKTRLAAERACRG